MSDDRRGLLEHVGDRSSVLVLASQRSADDEACIDLLTGPETGDSNVLSVTVSETPDERLALWRREAGERRPKRATVVDAGSGVPADSRVATSEEVPSLSVDTLPVDAGLVDVGMAIARHLSDWVPKGESTFLCLHSLTALLESFDRERVRSLVRALNALCDCMGVVGHHHMDPAAHSEETVATFRPQYGAVVEHLPDHGWIVSGDDDTVEPPSTRRSAPSRDGTGEPAGGGLVPLPYSLDAVLDALSSERRRTLLYYLRDEGGDATVSLDSVVERVQARETAAGNRRSPESADQVRLSLVHTHLPKLDDAGILTYDADDAVVEYTENPALESCLDYVETLESG